MPPADFEQHLRDLDRTAVPLLRRPGREVWRCDLAGTAALLHFYPAAGRISRGPATLAFANLKALQTAKIPALKPIALLSGFQFGPRKGDAILTDAPGRLQFLDDTLPPDRPHVRTAILDWLAALAKAGFGHGDLRPDAFLITGDRVLLADAAGLTRGGLTREHLHQFAHALGDRATLADRLRAWRRLVDPSDASVPPADRSQPARFARDVRGDAIDTVTVGDWTGRFRVTTASPVEWSVASRLFVTAADWQREWPRLVERLRADQLDVLKRDRSGDVLAGPVTLAGVPVDAILKRPRNKFWYRYLFDAFRHSRARRTWQKTLRLQARQLPVEYPLAVFERRNLGYVVEAIAVFEKVPGVTLEDADLDALPAAQRENLFRRCGRILRRIEATGLAHTDAKSSNWIVFDSAAHGPTPVLIDAYGVRRLTRGLQLFGIHRLLRAMRKHPQYRPVDSLHLCLGVSPRTVPEAIDGN